MSRIDVVNGRIRQLINDFGQYVEAYDRLVASSGERLTSHRDTIALLEKAGSLEAAVIDERFVASLRKTLKAWGLDKRGSRLVPQGEFTHALRSALPTLERFKPLTIDALDSSHDIAEQLWQTINSLGVTENRAMLVAGTKTLHHLLPNLVVPVDHRWTGSFFHLNDAEWQRGQHGAFYRIYTQFAEVARQVQPQQYVTGQGWRTSRTKILDNALIGFCKLEITGQSAEDETRAAVTFDVLGYPPAKNSAQSTFNFGHSHFPRVRLLLEAAQRACREQSFMPIDEGRVALDVVVRAPGQTPGDATNYLSGIADVLQDKLSSNAIDYLGDLAMVRLYHNDRQITEISYHGIESSQTGYTVTVRAVHGQP